MKSEGKTSSRLLLVESKDQLDTIYGFSIYVRFKLHAYYHPIIRQTNCINLKKLNRLKHENNAEFMKTRFSMKCQTRKYFFQELKYFFTIGVSHKVVLLSILLLKLEKRV